MFTKLHTKSYSNNDRLFFLLNPNDDIAENDPVRIVDALSRVLTSWSSKNCIVNVAAAHTIRR